MCDNNIVLLEKYSMEYNKLSKQIRRRKNDKCAFSRFDTICRGRVRGGVQDINEFIDSSDYVLVSYSKRKCKNEQQICGVCYFSLGSDYIYIQLLCTKKKTYKGAICSNLLNNMQSNQVILV